MSTKPFPRNPSLTHFKYQAKDLQKSHQTSDPQAIARIREFHPRFSKLKPEEVSAAEFKLSDAHLVIAREYGFASWDKLKTCTETVGNFGTDLPKSQEGDWADEFLKLICLTYSDADHPSRRVKAQEILAAHPEIRGSSIHVAAATGDLESATSWLKQKPGLAREKGGPMRWEPLLYLAYARFQADWSEPVAVARLLLQQGADANAGFLWDKNAYVFTALTGVFGEGEAGPVNQPPHSDETELATLLLNAGADANDTQALYNRMFTKGASHLKLLLEYGLGKPGRGPWFERMGGVLSSPQELLEEQLFWAVRNGHLDRVELLAGLVDLNEVHSRGKSLYEASVLSGYTEIAEYLLKHGAQKKALTPSDSLVAACTSGHREEALELLAQYPNLVETLGDRRGRLLASAAGNNHLEGVMLMLEIGFPVNSGDRTALHEAAWNGHLEMARLLVERGADPNIRDGTHDGRPVDWARHNGQEAVVEFLLPLTEPER